MSYEFNLRGDYIYEMFKEEFDECTINVEGKIYGLVTKTKNNKNKLKAVVCKNCKMVYLKQDEGKGR